MEIVAPLVPTPFDLPRIPIPQPALHTRKQDLQT